MKSGSAAVAETAKRSLKLVKKVKQIAAEREAARLKGSGAAGDEDENDDEGVEEEDDEGGSEAMKN
jgi:hypothetical protein